jgi:hypothetical protein
MKDPKALGALGDFSLQWLELQGAPTAGKDSQYTAWNIPTDHNVGSEVQDEALTDFEQLVFTANGALPDLLTSTSSYINSNLKTFYNVPMPTGGATVTVNDSALAQGQTQFTKVDMSSAHRAGILTSAGVMATMAHTTLPSAVLRGKLVREQLLCDPMGPPVPNAGSLPSSAPDGGTTRSLSAAHENKDGTCFSCHQLMDPIGFGFGNFDATGLYQATDANGFSGTFPPIDASGQVVARSPAEFSTTFNGASDLVKQLSGAAEVNQCFTIQELRYSLGRIETTADACSAQQAYSAFSSGQFNIQSLLVALVGTDAFRYRSVQTAGSKCQ